MTAQKPVPKKHKGNWAHNYVSTCILSHSVLAASVDEIVPIPTQFS